MTESGKLGTALDWVGYALMRNVVAAVQVLPWRSGRALARGLGRVACVLDRSTRKANAEENLSRAFPELSKQEVKAIIRDVYPHLSTVLLEGLEFSRAVMRGQGRGLLETEGFEQLKEAGRQTGVVFVSGHFGQWEVLGAAAQLLGYPLWTVRRGFDNVFVEDYVRRLRKQRGQRMLGKHRVLRRMIRLVERGQNVAMLIDQDARRHGLLVDFFGRPASTTTAPARLALRTGAPVAVVYGRRIEGRNRFRIVLENVVRPDPDADYRSEVRRITQRITHDLENVIRRAPERWLWLHRRWKTYPGKYPRHR